MADESLVYEASFLGNQPDFFGDVERFCEQIQSIQWQNWDEIKQAVGERFIALWIRDPVTKISLKL